MSDKCNCGYYQKSRHHTRIGGGDCEHYIQQAEIDALKQRVRELEEAQRWIPVIERLPDFDQYVEVFSNGVVQDHKWCRDIDSNEQWSNELVAYEDWPDIQSSDMWRAIEPPEAGE
ncbi:MAG: hypothetical protein KDI55_28680 [Anaerolineae bacterium]|nr:hypothetical protein [Anaerolineae bacterium]